jgi:hypothetical protein
VRDRRLQGIEAIVEREQGMSAKGDDDRLFLDCQHRRTRVPRSGGEIGSRITLLPLRNRLRVDSVPLRQRPQALLTMLYRSTDRLCRAGASMQNLSHSASFHAEENNAPSKPETKHLRPDA